ncbi:MAG: exodeoxyribonuclease VII large subunit [Rhabdaerophilum sp.]
MDDIPNNTPEYSVSDLAGALKRTLEDAFGHVRLRGEISGYRGPHSSGHVYFSIKDQNAKIDAVIWKGVFGKLKFRPEEGLEVIATGRITTFPGKSTYQIIVEAIEPAGVGALMALLEERRRKLTAEGVFDEARKKRLPYLPRVIGIITSPTGAVIRDMIHRLADRFPRDVLLWPVRVQGDGSAEEVAAAIRGFNSIHPGGSIPRPDVLIVARGGGSLEDLWSFNEEIVIRAAAECEIPLISAVGHETDWTLLDLVADIRAPTPSAAAEMVVPVRADLLHALRDRGARLAGGVMRLRDRARRDYLALIRALPDAKRLIENPQQRLDLTLAKREAAIRASRNAKEMALLALARRLSAQRPEARLARISERLKGLEARLPVALANRINLAKRDQLQGKTRFDALAERLKRAPRLLWQRQGERLGKAGQLLGALGYKQVLGRGFAVVRNAANQPVRSATMAGAESRLNIEFADGAIAVTPGADGVLEPAKVVQRTAKLKTGPDQGNLF